MQDLKLLTPQNERDCVLLHTLAFPKKWGKDAIKQFLLDPLILGYGNKQGFFLARFIAGESELLTICTHPKIRRTGLGGNMMQIWLQESQKRSIKKLFLEVGVKNQPAISLYQKFQFEIISVRKNYYRKGQNAYRMRRQLME